MNPRNRTNATINAPRYGTASLPEPDFVLALEDGDFVRVRVGTVGFAVIVSGIKLSNLLGVTLAGVQVCSPNCDNTVNVSLVGRLYLSYQSNDTYMLSWGITYRVRQPLLAKGVPDNGVRVSWRTPAANVGIKQTY